MLSNGKKVEDVDWRERPPKYDKNNKDEDTSLTNKIHMTHLHLKIYKHSFKDRKNQ